MNADEREAWKDTPMSRLGMHPNDYAPSGPIDPVKQQMAARRESDAKTDAYLAQMKAMDERRKLMKRPWWGNTDEDQKMSWMEVVVAWWVYAMLIFTVAQALRYAVHLWRVWEFIR